MPGSCRGVAADEGLMRSGVQQHPSDRCRSAHCGMSMSALVALARQRGSRAGPGLQPRRSALRCDCPALLGSKAPLQNSLRSLCSLHSDTCNESEHEAREYARGLRPLCCSAPPMRAGPCPAAPLRSLGWRAGSRTPALLPARRRAGRIGAAEKRRLDGRARIRALRALTRCSCPTTVSAANGGSSATGPASPASQVTRSVAKGKRFEPRPGRAHRLARANARTKQRTYAKVCSGPRAAFFLVRLNAIRCQSLPGWAWRSLARMRWV